MGWFKRKVKVNADFLIRDRVEKAFDEEKASLLKALAASKAKPNDMEASIYAAFQELLAMKMAGLDSDIRAAYAEQAYQFLKNSDPNQADSMKQRFTEYTMAFEQDVADENPHLAPTLIGQGLENMLGASDESVVLSRLALVMTHKACVEATVPFYKDLSIQT